MKEKIKITFANLHNINVIAALLISVVVYQIIAFIFWYWNIGSAGFVNMAFASIFVIIIGYRDNKGNKLWEEEFHLPNKFSRR